jgi:arabinofuranosyltransferase
VSRLTASESAEAIGVPTNRSTSPHASKWSWVALGVPLVVVLVGAWTYRWVQEDAFINFRIIGNLLAGHGPVFNVGERVEAYSDPLWLFLLAAIHRVVPFVSLEWLSVMLGLGSTAGGVMWGGRAIQRLGGARGDDLVLPMGLLVFSVVAGVWEFSTSGLEIGMVFGWIGLSFWLLVRTEDRRTSALGCGFVVGLGPLIRPELLLMSGVFLVTLGLVAAAPGWRGSAKIGRRSVALLLAASCLPVIYELWRMAYFGLLVPNTGLAKSGTSSWWSQGFTYLWNFVSPYTLWLPLGLAVPLVGPRLYRWWRTGDHIGVVVLLTPIAAALADTLYVVHLGGDHMHARLLLPAFLALCIPLYVEVAQLRSLLVIPLLGIVAWSVTSAGWLRWDSGGLYGEVFGTVHGIANERNIWIAETGKRNPITTADWRSYGLPGHGYDVTAAVMSRQKRQGMFVVTNPLLVDVVPGNVRAARSPLPFHLAVNLTNIGFIALEAGPQVYIFDRLSLANPIGSHFTIGAHKQAGGKVIDPVWMIARFGLNGEQSPTGAPSDQSVAAARRAISCPPLSSYLHAITGSLTFSRALSNIAHSYAYTTMSFSGDPNTAEQQLCHR